MYRYGIDLTDLLWYTPYMPNLFIVGTNDLVSQSPDIARQWSIRNPESVDTIYNTSGKKYWWECERGHEWKAQVSSRTRLRRGCPYCSGRLPVAGVNDLGTTHPELVEEWGEDNLLRPEEVSRGSTKKISWRCKQGHTWKATIGSRALAKNGCPYCAGQFPILGKTDLLTLHPELEEQWADTRDMSEFMSQSNYKASWRCKQGHTWKAMIYSVTLQNTGCPICSNKISRKETELLDFLKNYINEENIIQSDRSILGGKEIDIFIPSANIAIEFNGLYWHSESGGRGRQYHYDKWKMCADKGIQLLTIWEDDWRLKRPVVESMLRHKLQLSGENKIGARQCEVVSMDYHTARDFLESNHTQGAARGSLYLGLAYSNELVAVMVAKKRENGDWELVRYATNCIVQGGQSKLLKSAPKGRWITFADLCVSNGSLYEQTGWRQDGLLKPDYKYVVGGKRIHKFNYRLKRFRDDPDLLWEEGMTERELAQLNAIPRIWDCGKVRYTKLTH